jgi:hypothetical protein
MSEADQTHSIEWNKVLSNKLEFLKSSDNQNTAFMVQVFEFSQKDTKHKRIASFKNFNFGDIMSGASIKEEVNKREMNLKFSGYDSDKNYSFL